MTIITSEGKEELNGKKWERGNYIVVGTTGGYLGSVNVKNPNLSRLARSFLWETISFQATEHVC
jgi:hypothetical protein